MLKSNHRQSNFIVVVIELDYTVPFMFTHDFHVEFGFLGTDSESDVSTVQTGFN